ALQRISRTGRKTGGAPISRGHLYWILSNPIYVGRLRHKGQIHDGLHSAIIDPETFDPVQQKLELTRGRDLSTLAPLRVLRARTPEPAWARRVVDEGVRSCPRAGCGRSAC